MSSWAIIGGALAAGTLAWMAIAAVAWLGEGKLDVEPIRWFGAAALALVAVDIAGLAIHWSLPPALVGLGVVAGLASASSGRFDDPTADD